MNDLSFKMKIISYKYTSITKLVSSVTNESILRVNIFKKNLVAYISFTNLPFINKHAFYYGACL